MNVFPSPHGGCGGGGGVGAVGGVFEGKAGRYRQCHVKFIVIKTAVGRNLNDIRRQLANRVTVGGAGGGIAKHPIASAIQRTPIRHIHAIAVYAGYIDCLKNGIFGVGEHDRLTRGGNLKGGVKTIFGRICAFTNCPNDHKSACRHNCSVGENEFRKFLGII